MNLVLAAKSPREKLHQHTSTNHEGFFLVLVEAFEDGRKRGKEEKGEKGKKGKEKEVREGRGKEKGSIQMIKSL